LDKVEALSNSLSPMGANGRAVMQQYADLAAPPAAQYCSLLRISRDDCNQLQWQASLRDSTIRRQSMPTSAVFSCHLIVPLGLVIRTSDPHTDISSSRGSTRSCSVKRFPKSGTISLEGDSAFRFTQRRQDHFHLAAFMHRRAGVRTDSARLNLDRVDGRRCRGRC
jgi:hypothetical protein